MKRIWQLTCLLGLIASSTFAQTDFKMAVQAKIESGIIEGDYNTQTGIQTYFGVPFAKPPGIESSSLITPSIRNLSVTSVTSSYP